METEQMIDGLVSIGNYFVETTGNVIIETAVTSFFDYFLKPCNPGEIVYRIEIPKECDAFVIRDICEKYAKSYSYHDKNKGCLVSNKENMKKYDDTVGVGKYSQEKRIEQINKTTRPFKKDTYSNNQIVNEICDRLVVEKYNADLRDNEAKEIKKNTVNIKFIDEFTNKEQIVSICKNKGDTPKLKFVSSIDDERGRELIRDIAECLGVSYSYQEYGKSRQKYLGKQYDTILKEKCLSGYPSMEEVLNQIVLPKQKWLQCCGSSYTIFSDKASYFYPIPIEIRNNLALELRIEAQCSASFYNDPSLRCELCLMYNDDEYIEPKLMVIIDNEKGIQKKSLYLSEMDKEVINDIINEAIKDKYKYLVDKEFR